MLKNNYLNSSKDARYIPLAEPWLSNNCADAVRDQVNSTFIGPGGVTEKFGKKLAAITNSYAAIPVSSGTTALSIAANVLGLQDGDEIIVPSYGVISVINAFSTVRLRPKLVEISLRTGCIDPNHLLDIISPKTKAVVFIDFCGSIGPELEKISIICQKRGMYLIEDAAWSLGRNINQKVGGSFGDIAITSFSVPKIITTGQGGAIFVRSEDHYSKVICAIDQGDTNWRQTNLNRSIGGNFRLSDISSSLGLAQLESIEERLTRKKRVFEKLKLILGQNIFMASDGGIPSQNIIFTEQPEQMVNYLRKKSIFPTQQYRPIYHHPPYSGLGDFLSFPNAEYWFKHSVYLPFGLALDESDAERIGLSVIESKISLISP